VVGRGVPGAARVPGVTSLFDVPVLSYNFLGHVRGLLFESWQVVPSVVFKQYLPGFPRRPSDNSMKKPVRKASAKKVGHPRSAKQVAIKQARTVGSRTSANLHSGGKLTFNHAMIYVKDVDRALRFYQDLLGFKLIEDFRYEGTQVYARMSAPGGDGTIALHQAGPSDSLSSDGVRLYFEVRDLDDFCRKLQQKGFFITKLPRMMPWGWRHAYLNDPDGHEISLYWAGENRMKKTMMRAAGQHAKAATQSS
jgi:catechol 2,3-dioxygenase-like lactoylglutathione lyase family enzyme